VRRAALALALAAAASLLVLGGAYCASDGEGDASQSARAELQAHTGPIRAAAEANDRRGAELALGQFRTAVTRLQSQGQLGPDRAERYLSLAAQVEANLSLLPPPPAPTTEAPPASTVTTDRGQDGGEERGDDKGKGKGGKGKNDD
jgi:hypothetical protein